MAVGEFFYGANKSSPSRRESNRKLFADFVGEYPVLGIDKDVASVYSQVKYDLVSKGVNIPENDVWIAAIAMSSSLRLITCDRHFADIHNLNVEIL